MRKPNKALMDKIVYSEKHYDLEETFSREAYTCPCCGRRRTGQYSLYKGKVGVDSAMIVYCTACKGTWKEQLNEGQRVVGYLE